MDPKWTSGNELEYLKSVLSNSKDVKENPFTLRLEEAFCKKYGVKYAIAINSGTSGLHAALIAAGVQPGDEVITTPFTVLVDSSVPVIMGAKPVFADIEKDTHNIDPDSIEKVITEKTKAIIPVSHDGLPYDIDNVKKIADEHDLIVVEDNAQAMLAEYKGRLVGQDAHITMFSFERTKHVSCGEGGMLITNNEELATKARKFAGMGFKNLSASASDLVAGVPLEYQTPNYERNDEVGLNYRFNEFLAAITLAQFERVDELVQIRRDIAKLYDKIFAGTKFIPQKVPEGYVSSYFTYAVESPYSDITQWKKFHDYHIENGGDDFYAAMILGYEEPIMKKLGYYEKYKGKCPVAEEIQPKMMQFKTNYRTIDEAQEQIEKLKTSLENFV
ncbi:UDP-4-amino-4-deoxy-L-arabinose--oxoglutarate aminotransferase protein [Marine Group I thaumarchaeote SCGC AAA799-P11]|uniref:UDP-4-amino-4-deoxy-L-arabinose--oxoglutarate aminotransferase protein n=1 Tax=Marine Group I thaumarchaeote SCGC AAA799-P11 TaxID=1502295 RepID=A0A087S2Y9_9ARCH|nr:UDP-4-amino-4-deoxy-L-arabinose--oxoglutarate aminotransferase protein [Marine Group I thaumarchaeote SCGC AAA799-P11]